MEIVRKEKKRKKQKFNNKQGAGKQKKRNEN